MFKAVARAPWGVSLWPALPLHLALVSLGTNGVASSTADFALAAIRADTPALQAEPFCSDAFYLVCPEQHPLARRRKPLAVADLAGYPFIHLARHSSVRQYLEAAFHPQAMRTLMEVEQLATVTGMVRAGLGISVVPADRKSTRLNSSH